MSCRDYHLVNVVRAFSVAYAILICKLFTYPVLYVTTNGRSCTRRHPSTPSSIPLSGTVKSSWTRNVCVPALETMRLQKPQLELGTRLVRPSAVRSIPFALIHARQAPLPAYSASNRKLRLYEQPPTIDSRVSRDHKIRADQPRTSLHRELPGLVIHLHLTFRPVCR